MIDIPELAQRNVAALLEEKGRALALLRVDAGGGSLTLSYRGELISVRRMEIAPGQLAADDDSRQALVERLVLEVQRSLDHFDRQFSSVSVSRLVLAMNPRVKGLASALASSIEQPVAELDLSSAIDFPAVPELREPQFQARHLLAIGAALRGEGTTAEPTVFEEPA